MTGCPQMTSVSWFLICVFLTASSILLNSKMLLLRSASRQRKSMINAICLMGQVNVFLTLKAQKNKFHLFWHTTVREVCMLFFVQSFIVRDQEHYWCNSESWILEKLRWIGIQLPKTCVFLLYTSSDLMMLSFINVYFHCKFVLILFLTWKVMQMQFYFQENKNKFMKIFDIQIIFVVEYFRYNSTVRTFHTSFFLWYSSCYSTYLSFTFFVGYGKVYYCCTASCYFFRVCAPPKRGFHYLSHFVNRNSVDNVVPKLVLIPRYICVWNRNFEWFVEDPKITVAKNLFHKKLFTNVSKVITFILILCYLQWLI